MTLPRRFLRLGLSVSAYVVAFPVLLLLTGFVGPAPGFSRLTTLVFLAVVLVVPALAAIWTAKTLTRRWGSATRGLQASRGMRYLLASTYVLTAAFGVPAVISEQNRGAVDAYKQLRAEGDRGVWDVHPYIQSYLAIPVLPCLVVSYSEYQVAGKQGWGGFELTLWYGVGVESLSSLMMWIS